MKTHTDPQANEAWYRQPVLWLGMVIFAASLAGCIWLITVSLRHDETPQHRVQSILGVPVAAPAAEGSAP
jgi:hypothetical protein